MGPFSEQTQLARSQRVIELLNKPGLSAWARDYWTRVLKELAHNEATYNYRVYNTYKHLGRTWYE